MNRIQDKKRWWAANFCNQTAPIRQNRSFDILAPLGLMLAITAVFALAALAYSHPGATAGISLANAPTFTLIKEAIDGQVTAFEAYKKTHGERTAKLESENADLKTRIEDIEAKRSGPGLTGDGRTGVLPEFKAYPTATGTVYEVPSGTKFADVIPVEEKDRPKISLERWLAAAMLGEKCQDREAVRYAMEQKQLETTTTGLQVPTQFIAQWVDRLRAQMVLNACGMRTVMMDAKTQTRSAITADPAASWHTESANINAANPTFAERQLSASTIVARCTCSMELAQDSPDFGNQLAGVMLRSIAAELDRAGLIGSGTPPEPTGIVNTSGIGSISGGAITDYSKFVSAVQTLLTAGVPLDIATRNVLMSPYTWATLENLPTGISGDKTQLPRPRALADSVFRPITSLPHNSPIEDVAVMGDFTDLLMGVRKEASVEVLKLTSYAGNLQLEFIAYSRADFVVVRPPSFVKIAGLI